MKINERNEILKNCIILKDCLNAEMEKIVPQEYDNVIRTEKEHPEWCAVNRKNYEIARNSYHYFTEIADYAKELYNDKKYVKIITDAKDILGQGIYKTYKVVLMREYMDLISNIEYDFNFYTKIGGRPAIKIKA